MSPPAKNVPSPIASSVTTAASLPSVPAVETSTGLRTIVLPGDLVTWFLAIAKSNSDQNIETLGTFGVQLCNNKFLVTHLNINFLGWIHSHPTYSVLLSSVDMHNQYQWQCMLL